MTGAPESPTPTPVPAAPGIAPHQPPTRSGLLPALCAVQGRSGYLSRQELTELSRSMSLPLSEVYGVATFYSLLSLSPRGKVVVHVCDSPTCHSRAVQGLLPAFQDALGIGPGETTSDGRFSLERASCLGHCGEAPVMASDHQVHGKMSPREVPEWLSRSPGKEV